MVYAVRKRRGRWTVCSDDNVVLQFETYDEAVATVRGAVAVLEHRSRLHEVPCQTPLSGSHGEDAQRRTPES